jgi:hypothetical protein
MDPIRAIQTYKAGQQLKAALKPATKSPIGATDIGFDANQAKAVIKTEDGGQLYAQSITNGYRFPGQAVRVDQDGSAIVSDSAPRIKLAPTSDVASQAYGKLKILYFDKGALWIGGDRRIPKRLKTDFALDLNNYLSFNNLGDGDRYILSGRDLALGRIATIKNGVKLAPPVGIDFGVVDSRDFRNLFVNPGYFSANSGFGHGFFLNNVADLGASAIYWDGINYEKISNPDFYYNLDQDAGAGLWWISPGVSRPVSYSTLYDMFGVPDDNSDRWGVSFVSKNLDSIGVWHAVENSNPNGGGFGFLERYIYRRKTEQLELFGTSFTATRPATGPEIGIYDFPNWVGKNVYSIRHISAFDNPTVRDLAQDRDRNLTISISQEAPGDIQLFQAKKTIKTPVYRIPKTAIIRAYSYHP